MWWMLAIAAHAASPGEILVVNHAGGPVDVRIDGFVHPLSAGEQAVLPTLDETSTFVVTYRQFGHDRVLLREAIDVAPGGETVVTIPPETTARVRVTNPTASPAELLDGGEYVATLPPHAIEIVRVEAGSAPLSMVVDGRTIASTMLSLEPFAEPTWNPADPPAPASEPVDPRQD